MDRAVAILVLKVNPSFIYAYMADKSKRPRAVHDNDILTDKLYGHAISGGKSFIRYSDATDVKTAALDVDAIKKCKPILKDIGTKSIKKTTLKVVFKRVLKECNKTWKIKEENLEDWVDTMVNRLANILHHWQRASGKGTSWANFNDDDDDDDDDADGADSKPKKDDKQKRTQAAAG